MEKNTILNFWARSTRRAPGRRRDWHDAWNRQRSRCPGWTHGNARGHWIVRCDDESEASARLGAALDLAERTGDLAVHAWIMDGGGRRPVRGRNSTFFKFGEVE